MWCLCLCVSECVLKNIADSSGVWRDTVAGVWRDTVGGVWRGTVAESMSD
jgi:hypothetical protein